MTDGTDSFGGDMRVQHGAECGQVQVAVDAAELPASLDHPGGAPAQRHSVVLPVRHVARVGAGDGGHRLDAGEQCGLGVIGLPYPCGDRGGEPVEQLVGLA